MAIYIKNVLTSTLVFFAFSMSLANAENRIPEYSSYIELKNGEVICGEEYESWHESSTGEVVQIGRAHV